MDEIEICVVTLTNARRYDNRDSGDGSCRKLALLPQDRIAWREALFSQDRVAHSAILTGPRGKLALFPQDRVTRSAILRAGRVG